jgi:hypothetical protein
MNTKEQLVHTVKEWMQIEQEIKVLQKELKQRRESKKKLTKVLIETMKTNEIDCFDTTNGKIIYTKNKVRIPISKTHLMTSITNYFKDTNNETAQELTNFILETREVKTTDKIRLKDIHQTT